MIRWLLRRLFHHSPTSRQKRETEIRDLQRGIIRNEAKLNEMYLRWDHGACCPACMFGGQWSAVTEKIERQEKRLRLLIARRPH